MAPRSRTDLMALLDVMLLVFFAVTVSKDKEHKKETKSLKATISSQRVEKAAAQKALEAKEKKVRSLEKEASQIRALIKKLQVLANKMKVKANFKQPNVQQLAGDLRRVHSAIRRGFSRWEKRLSNLQSKHTALKGKLSTSEKRLASLQEEYDKAVRKVKQLSGQQKVLQERDNELKVKLKLAREERDQNKQKLLLLQQRLRLSQSLVKQWRDDARALQKQLNKQNKRLQSIAIARALLKQQVARLEASLKQMKEQQKSWVKQRKSFTIVQVNFAKKHKQLKEQVRLLQARVSQQKIKGKVQTKTNKALQDELDKLKHVQAVLQKQKTAWASKYATWLARKKKFEQSSLSQKKTIAKLRASIASWQKKHKAAEATTTALQSLQNKTNVQVTKLEKTLQALRKKNQKLTTDHARLLAKMKIWKDERYNHQVALQTMKKKVQSLQRTSFLLRAERDVLKTNNEKLMLRAQKIRLALEKLQLDLQRQKLALKEQKESFALAKKHLTARNKRLKESREQLEQALRTFRQWGTMTGREQAGLTKSLSRYFQAVMVYVKADRIIGYRRFPAISTKRFSRPIELSRRTSNGRNLYYRGKVEKNFRAFDVLKRKLPTEHAGKMKAIYIFVFDDECSTAITSGLESEHLKYYRKLNVVWQL